MISCKDDFRPVSFLLEALDEDAVKWVSFELNLFSEGAMQSIPALWRFPTFWVAVTGLGAAGPVFSAFE